MVFQSHHRIHHDAKGQVATADQNHWTARIFVDALEYQGELRLVHGFADYDQVEVVVGEPAQRAQQALGAFDAVYGLAQRRTAGGELIVFELNEQEASS